MVIVDPVFFALTSTPSSGPSSAAVTRPVNATAGGACARTGVTRGNERATAPPTIVASSRNVERIGTSGGRPPMPMIARTLRHAVDFFRPDGVPEAHARRFVAIAVDSEFLIDAGV